MNQAISLLDKWKKEPVATHNRASVFFSQDIETHLAKWNGCTACPLGDRSRNHVGYDATVPADTLADVLLIGEGPGKGEDNLGLPFVGVSGRFLRAAITNTGFTDLNVGFTNMVMCRPCDKMSGPNRTPDAVEVARCNVRLVELIKLVQPYIIILCGMVAGDSIGNRLRSTMPGRIVQIQHPRFILEKGGAGSDIYPAYVHAVRQAMNQAHTMKGAFDHDQRHNSFSNLR